MKFTHKCFIIMCVCGGASMWVGWLCICVCVCGCVKREIHTRPHHCTPHTLTNTHIRTHTHANSHTDRQTDRQTDKHTYVSMPLEYVGSTTKHRGPLHLISVVLLPQMTDSFCNGSKRKLEYFTPQKPTAR